MVGLRHGIAQIWSRDSFLIPKRKTKDMGLNTSAPIKRNHHDGQGSGVVKSPLDDRGSEGRRQIFMASSVSSR
jgi:hypothetical protein